MLCPICETPVPAGQTTCTTCGGSPLLHGRFALERLLGAGGQSRVFAATDQQTGQPVAVKMLSLARVHDPKTIELFRRAAGVLAGLAHPAIPRTIMGGKSVDKRPLAVAIDCATGRERWRAVF